MIVLGIVGSPAGGKSTAAKILAEWGAVWINADLIARDALQHPEVIGGLVNHFGDAILGADGRVERTALADLVFGNDSSKRANLRVLESLVHPRTRSEITRRIIAAAEQDRPVVLLDIPLMFESGWDRACDAIWCLHATRENRLLRIKDRGWDAAELQRREANQIAIEQKKRLSNVVMRNDSTLDALRRNLRCSWDDLAKIEFQSGPRRERAAAKHCLSDRT